MLTRYYFYINIILEYKFMFKLFFFLIFSAALCGANFIHEAASMGNQDLLLRLLNNGVNPNIRNSNGFTPLTLAIINGHEEAAIVLINNGTYINLESGNMSFVDEISYLHLATAKGLKKVVKALLNGGDNPNQRTNIRSYTPLQIAAKHQQHHIIKTLIKAYADPNLDFDKTNTNIVDAAKIIPGQFTLATKEYPDLPSWKRWIFTTKTETEILNQEIKDKRDLYINKALLGFRSLPIHFAISDLKTTLALLDSGANPNLRDSNASTALHLAIEGGFFDTALALINLNGTDLYALNGDQKSPLELALAKKHWDIAAALIQAGVNPNSKKPNGSSIVSIAIREMDGEILNSLVDAMGCDKNKILMDFFNAGNDINEKDINGETVLHLAVRKNEKDWIMPLIKNGASLEASNKYGWTPLFSAIHFNSKSAFEALLEAGANLDSVDTHRNTLLHFAAQNGKTEWIDYLIQKGIALEAINCRGGTPLIEAIVYEREETLEALLRAGANPNVQDTSKKTPLHFATQIGKANFIKILIQHEADLEICDNWNFTPLQKAVNSGQEEAFLVLLEAGADSNRAFTEGKPLPLIDYCLIFGKLDFFSILYKKGANLSPSFNGLLHLRTALIHKEYPKALVLIDLGFGSQKYREIMEYAVKNAKTLAEITYYREEAARSVEEGFSSFPQVYKDKIFAQLEKFNQEILPQLNSIISNELAQKWHLKTSSANNNNHSPPLENNGNIIITSECLVCSEEVEQLFDCIGGNLECKLTLCKTCLEENLEKLCKNKFERPVCANQKCHALVQLDRLYQAGCEVELIEALQRNLVRLEAKNSCRNYRACFNDECLNGKTIENGHTKFNCPLCTFEGCLECGKKLCSDNCPANKNQNILKDKLYKLGKLPPPKKAYENYSEDEEEFLHGRYRICPHCGDFIERADGCNNMKCSSCKKTFHWNDGLKNANQHDFRNGPMRYEHTLREKGFLKFLENEEGKKSFGGFQV